MGFVGGKQSAGLLQANVLPRDILYTHTFVPARVSSSTFAGSQWRAFWQGLRGGAAMCTRVSLPPPVQAPSINSTSLVHCDLFPKPRTANARALRVTYRVHSARELSAARLLPMQPLLLHLRCISLWASGELESCSMQGKPHDYWRPPLREKCSCVCNCTRIEK